MVIVVVANGLFRSVAGKLVSSRVRSGSVLLSKTKGIVERSKFGSSNHLARTREMWKGSSRIDCRARK